MFHALSVRHMDLGLRFTIASVGAFGICWVMPLYAGIPMALAFGVAVGMY